jgi:hypothetical protein
VYSLLNKKGHGYNTVYSSLNKQGHGYSTVNTSLNKQGHGYSTVNTSLNKQGHGFQNTFGKCPYKKLFQDSTENKRKKSKTYMVLSNGIL